MRTGVHVVPHCLGSRPLGSPIPTSREHPSAAGEYTGQFEALLLEEAREAVRGGWAEAVQAGHLFDAAVIGCVFVLGLWLRLGLGLG